MFIWRVYKTLSKTPKLTPMVLGFATPICPNDSLKNRTVYSENQLVALPLNPTYVLPVLRSAYFADLSLPQVVVVLPAASTAKTPSMPLPSDLMSSLERGTLKMTISSMMPPK